MQFGERAKVGHVANPTGSDCYVTTLAYGTRVNKDHMRNVVDSSTTLDSGAASYRDAIRVAFELLGNSSTPEDHNDRGMRQICLKLYIFASTCTCITSRACSNINLAKILSLILEGKA